MPKFEGGMSHPHSSGTCWTGFRTATSTQANCDDSDITIAPGVTLSFGRAVTTRCLPVRIFRNKSFSRFAAKADIDDTSLCHSIRDAERGLIAADLGGGVIKQRIARAGQGKSSGFRTLILFRSTHRAFFVPGFAKNERDNISRNELIALRKLASELLACDDRTIEPAIFSGTLVEVICHEETIS